MLQINRVIRLDFRSVLVRTGLLFEYLTGRKTKKPVAVGCVPVARSRIGQKHTEQLQFEDYLRWIPPIFELQNEGHIRYNKSPYEPQRSNSLKVYEKGSPG